ncbi:MAG: type II toxin-antitoxin system HicA family toxin [Synechococcales cyanobacterium CRU_2_2]|nr:type II toxin-antitoxin system HicA family toxin [Synechococcales cyanobacterium CRU_2_2]
MPKKIRELKAELQKSGFVMKPGKGSHTKWTHPDYAGFVVISGKDSSDAKRYQEKLVELALKIIEESKE